ncbi:portal protein [Streptomyces phage ClubPenguin]|nr:portal protein [Streptomyces phage ClubPenguin]
MASLITRMKEGLKHSWNLFTDPNYLEGLVPGGWGGGYTNSPSRSRARFSNERSIISSIYTRLAIDVAAIDIRHVQLDENGRYQNDRVSGLQDCLNVEANIDQGGRQFRQDMAQTIFEEGVIAIVPVDTDINPADSASYIINTMRVGRVVEFYPQHVRVNLYDERDGQRKDITVPKKTTAIVENPLFSVMNEPNSTLQRLIRKLNMLDAVDEQSSSGKLDMIIQLPYVIKSESRRQQAEQRRQDIEFQLKGSQYGIAYTDGTEKITQLNRPAENNLLTQIEYLTKLLYAQLGLTEEVMNGTADEKAMLNYFNRTIEPVIQAIAEAMKRTFLTKTARTQGQSIMYFRDPFKLVPMETIAEIADKFTRNEIASSNDIRQAIGWRPSKDPKADQLVNSNMPQPGTPTDGGSPSATPGTGTDPTADPSAAGDAAIQSGLDDANSVIDSIFSTLGIPDG